LVLAAGEAPKGDFNVRQAPQDPENPMKEKPTSMTVHIATRQRPQARHLRHANFRHCFQISAAVLLLGSPLSFAADLLRWDVDRTTQFEGTTAVATAVVAGVSGSKINGGGTAGDPSSPANTWNRTFAASADFAAAQTAGNHFSFTTTIASGYTATFTGVTVLTLSKTSNAPTSAGLFYSTDDGVTFTQTGTTSGTSTGAGTAAAFSSTMSVTPLVVAGGESGKTVRWRIVVFGLAGRIGIIKNNAASIDLALTGTSVPDIAIPMLLWTGTGGNNWNTLAENTNWADTLQADAPAPFIVNNNVTIAIPATIAVDAGGVTAGTVTVANPTGTVAITDGSIGALSLTKNEAGTLSLAGNHVFADGVTIGGGVLQAESNTALGVEPIAISGATLKTTTGATALSNPMSLGISGGTIDTDGNVTFSGNITGTSTGRRFLKTGSGELTLSGTLGAQISAPIDLDIAAGSVVLSGTSKQKNVGGFNSFNGNLTLNGSVLMLHGSTVTGTGSIIAANAASSITSRLNEGAVNIANPVVLNSNLSLESPSGNNQMTLSGPISGDYGLIKKGNGTVELSGTSTYLGSTTINASSLRLRVLANGGEASSIGASSAAPGNLVLAGGTLQYTGAAATTTDRQFTIGTSGGGIASIGTGVVNFSNPNSIIMTAPATIAADALTGGVTYRIVTSGDTDFTLIGASDSAPGTVFVATGTGIGTGTVVSFGSSRTFLVSGTASGTNRLALQIPDGINGPTLLGKTGVTTWSLTGNNTYTGATSIAAGTLRIDGNQSAAAGLITVASAAALGGNGISGAPVILQSGGGLTARISDWTGNAGTGYDDLTVASLDAASVPMTLVIDATALANFSETSKSFTILNTGGITNFSAANVTITAPGFAGTGTWSVAETTGSLVLSYTAPDPSYSTWATANGISGELASGDFDKDGLSNLVEYALGLNPTTSSVPPGSFNGSLLSFTKGTEAKANGDLTYEIEQSSDLSEWVVVVPHNAESLEISHTLPSGLTKEFARLKVTQLP
jgi:autotransporter-associated beta strand protein